MVDFDDVSEEQFQELLRNVDILDPLDPLTPEEGVQRYLESKTDISESSKKDNERSLSNFLDYCEKEGIENLNDLTERHVDEYKLWRKSESSDYVDELAPKTMQDEMFLFRAFLIYLESIVAVKSGLADAVQIPSLDDGDGVRDYDLENETVEEILEYLEKYAYASKAHVVWILCCRTGRRPGGLYSLDVDDVYLDVEEPYISFNHREQTELKNNSKSEKEVNITEEVTTVLRDYIADVRPDVVDGDRAPLIASSDGRLSISTMRKYFYKFTRPCAIGNPCPHNRNPDTCEAANNMDTASKCPSAAPPYATRHGHITTLRRQGVPIEIISDRCDVSPEIIKKHYDERSEKEKRERRRKILDGVRDDAEGYL
jgi:integrase